MQVVVGSAALTIPIAFSEESWNLSRSLPMINVMGLFVLSLLLISIYSVQGIFQSRIKSRFKHFILRTFIDYAITLAVVFIILLVLNKMPVIEDPLTALKRLILVAFPASMGGVIVDGFDKE